MEPGSAFPKVGLAFVLIAACSCYGAESRWIRLQSANFEMFSSAGPRSARDTIREFEQVRGFFLQAFGGLPPKAVPVRLVAFGSSREFEPYRPNAFADAYYHPTADRDYIVMGRSGADVFPLAVHEYVHLLVRRSGLDLPPWLNEGLAELYSTLRPYGDKILVGDLIPGRQREMLQGKWVPLAVILAADRHSPYYNEKDKAGSLYNEGWALTHMLYFRAGYRLKFSQVMRTISGGKESAQALQEVYGRTLAEIEKDLRAYLEGRSFQGVLVPAKLEKVSGEIPVEPVPDFDTALMLTDLTGGPGSQAAQRAAFERLVQQDPKRPEPYRRLGYLAWGAGRGDEAIEQFGRAFERGDRSSGFLWDYGRLLRGKREQEAIRILSALLAQDAARTDVRLELAETQMQADRAADALATLGAMRTVEAGDAARYFRIAVYAHLRNNDWTRAEATAKHFQDVAKTAEDRTAAESLVSLAAAGRPQPDMRPAVTETADTGSPGIRRVPPPAEPGGLKRREPLEPERPSATGRFLELECQGKVARIILETAAGRKAFLIDDPGNILIKAGSDGPVAMNCGKQKAPVTITVEYDPPPANRAGLDGIVRALAF
jgi:tetratricopeptide (TPR) repeat protein